MEKTFYEILGVAENATSEEIEAAFKAKAREVHPDAVSPDNAYLRKIAAEAFKDLSEAKAVLLDRTAREKYDAALASAAGQAHGGQPGASRPTQAGPRPQAAPAQAPRRVRRVTPPPRAPRSVSSLLFMLLGLGAIFSLGAFVWSDRMPPFWLAALTACFGILCFLHGMRPKATGLIGSGKKPLAISAAIFVAIFLALCLFSPPSNEAPLVTRYVAPALAGSSRANASHPPASAHGRPNGSGAAVAEESGEGEALATKVWRNLKDGQNYRTRLNGDVLFLEAINGTGTGIGEIISCEFHRASQNWIGVCSERNPQDQKERKASATLSDFSEARLEGNTNDIPVFVMMPVDGVQAGKVASQGSDLAEPDLSKLDPREKQSIESACAADKLMEGPAAYNSCLRKQLEALKTAPKPPDLSHLSSPDRDGIELICANAKLMEGPAAYNACLTRQVELLKKRH
jgi:DnaJ domain